jgi:uncharacterized protein (TIGR00299 family) protein
VILYLDPFMGMAGDMTVSALVDAGADPAAVNDALGRLAVPGLCFRFEEVRRKGVRALHGTVDLPREQDHRRLGQILALIEAARLPGAAADKAAQAFRRLAEAEAAVHGCSVEEIHFHEVGAADAIADIVAACTAWDCLGRPRVVCGPLNLGSGETVMEHGTFPVPPPAVVELLKGVPVFSRGPAVELTTPTGAALAVILAERFGPMPHGTLRRAGYGAGSRETLGAPNVLRVLLLDESPAEGLVALVESQVDDMSPELLGGSLDALRTAGALDVFVTPVQAKKGRPAWTVSVLCAPGQEERFADLILEQTTSTGARFSLWRRRELAREVRTVPTPYGPLRVKVATTPAGRLRSHPEWEDLRALSEKAGVPPLALLEEIRGLLPS